MALKFKRPKTQGQLKRHIADVEERMRRCPKCDYEGVFIRNGYMVKKSLPTHIQKIKKYKCPTCGHTGYDDWKPIIDEYEHSTLRLILHLYIEGLSKKAISNLLKENDIKITSELAKTYLTIWWRLGYHFLIDNKLKRKQPKSAKDYVKSESYVYGFLVQDRSDLTLIKLLNGKVQGSKVLGEQDREIECGTDVILRIVFHLFVEGIDDKSIFILLDNAGFKYQEKEIEEFLEYHRFIGLNIINRKQKIDKTSIRDYKRGVGYSYSLLIMEKANEVSYEVIKGKMKNPDRKLYNPEMDSYLKMNEQNKLAKRIFKI